MGTLSSLKWLNRFLSETPGDSQIGGPARQVANVCWSRVLPTPAPNAEVRIWSDEMAKLLELTECEDEVLLEENRLMGWIPMLKGMADINS